MFCCAGFLARADRTQRSTMPVPPPPAPPPPPTLALVSFTGGKCTICTLCCCCCLSHWIGCPEILRCGWGYPWYLGKALQHFVYGWSLILREGPSPPLPSSAHVDVTIHSNFSSFYSSHTDGWSGGETTACLSQGSWSLAIPLPFSRPVLPPCPVFYSSTYVAWAGKTQSYCVNLVRIALS